MPRRRDTALSLSGITVRDAHSKTAVEMGELRGVQVLVLIRHRH